MTIHEPPLGWVEITLVLISDKNLFFSPTGKKAPSSFLGMRGRRDYSEGLSYLEDEIPLDESEDLMMTAQSDITKRAPSSFLGMRGKKAPSGTLVCLILCPKRTDLSPFKLLANTNYNL